jgi:sulfur transfer complex TusBCD TusB component (DsrH family)
MGAFEEGSAFLAGVLAKVPEALRAQVKEALEKPEAKDAVILLGDGVLARSDYSKHMDAIKAKEAEITTQKTDLDARLASANDWWTVNKDALQDYVKIKPEYDVLKTRGGGDGDGDGDGDGVKSGLSKEDIQKLVDAGVRTGLGSELPDLLNIQAFMFDTGIQHYALFNEPVKLQELVTNPKLGKPIAGQPGRVFSLQDAYTEKYGERVAAKQKEAADKVINDEVQKRVTEELTKRIGQPFPIRESAPSVLDVLATKEGSAAHTLDSALAEYDRLQAARSA